VDGIEQCDFSTEISVLSSVSHPNIIGYFGSFQEDGVMNVVMEYADNGSLVRPSPPRAQLCWRLPAVTRSPASSPLDPPAPPFPRAVPARAAGHPAF